MNRRLRLAGTSLLALAGGCAAPPAPHDHAMHAGSADKTTESRAAMWQKSLAREPMAVTAAFDARGRLWRTQVRDGRILVSVSDDAGASFAAPSPVNALPERIAADGENRPKLAFGNGGAIYVSWTQSLETPFAGHVRFARSLDGGNTFSPPVTVNDDRAAISHRFDSLIVDNAGRVHLVWLDKRDKHAAEAAPQPFAGISVYHAISTDRGTSFNSNRRVAAHSCECCRIALALDTDGVPVALWRHVYGKNVRDHALLRLDGRTPLRRVGRDDWAIDACPHHGPSLAVDAAGTYHAAWFTGAPGRAGLYYARSTDGGASWTEPLAIGKTQAARPAVLAAGDVIHLAWKEFDGQNSIVLVMHSSDGGAHWSAPRAVARSASASDHPQLLRHRARVYLSWNAQTEGHRVLDVTP
jgi:hypothetical protein